MKQTPSPVKRLWELTGTHRRAYMLSIILAILSVACGMIPYFAIAYIMLCLIDGVTALNTYAAPCAIQLIRVYPQRQRHNSFRRSLCFKEGDCALCLPSLLSHLANETTSGFFAVSHLC